MITGIIDLGSNTVRLSIYYHDDHTVKLLMNKKTMVGIISYIDNKLLSEKGTIKLIDVLSQYKEILDNFKISNYFCFSTASLRNITNREDVIEKVLQESGITIEPISAQYEAYLDFIGAKKFCDLHEGFIIDIGGGSTELVEFVDNNVIQCTSAPIGSLSLYNQYVSKILPSKAERKEIKIASSLAFEALEFNPNQVTDNCVAIGVGGSIRAINTIVNDIFELPKNNKVIEIYHLKKVLDLFKKSSQFTQQKILQVAPDRIHTLYPALIEFYVLLKSLNVTKVIVSNSGVREGFLFEKIRGHQDNE